MRAKLTDDPPIWKCKTWAERLNQSATALALYGVMTDKERERVHARLMKKLKQEQEQSQ